MIAWLRRAFPQDDFADDWYGWLTNQTSHIGLGVLIAVLVCGVSLLAIGEFPVKWMGWTACAAIYLALEWARGWSGWDSAEDWAFVSCYGSGGAFVLFTELQAGSPVLFIDFSALPWLLALPAIHLALGAYLRA